MKVIGINGNYGSAASTALDVYLMADSALQFNRRPLFLPDFAPAYTAQAALVVRIGRMGRHIAPRFAHRYWDAVTVGMMVRATGCEGLSDAITRSFDGAAVLGTMVAVDELSGAIEQVTLEARVGDTLLCRGNASQLAVSIDEMIARLSQYYTFKTGDLIYTGEWGDALPVTINDRLSGSLDGRNVLEINVK